MNQPNIILILTDHFRRDALRPDLTPNLWKLAGEGTRFSLAYSASPLCQPARSCIITGMLPTHTGVCGNQSEPLHERGDWKKTGTFMQRLQQAGYTTALVGKHHYIDRYGIGMDVTNDDTTIQQYGFDHVFQVNDDGENIHNDDEYTKWLAERGKLDAYRARQAQGKIHPLPADETADGFIGLNGVQFIEEHKKDTPFYLNLSFIGPHPPFWNPSEFKADAYPTQAPVGAPDSENTRELRGRYQAKCELIDHYVGKLVETLKQKELYENTVIVFTSDHGDCLGDFGIWDKRYFYETSVGVPLFMAGPGVPAQTRGNGPKESKALVSHLDLYPTLLGLAGTSAEPDRRRNGRDLISMVQGETSGHEFVISEISTAMMVRTPNWKLCYDAQSGGVQQLYNLIRDPKELDNLAGVAGYEQVTLDLVGTLLSDKIRRTQFTHIKEEQRLQRVHVP